MLYRILADLVVVLHLAFIIFNTMGGLLVIWRKWIAWFQIPSTLWGSFIIILGWTCPLTPLEQHFRTLSGGEGYRTSFIAHYVTAIIYPTGLSRTMQINLGIGALVINVVIYCYIILRQRDKKK